MQKIGLISGTVPIQSGEQKSVYTDYGFPSSPLSFFTLGEITFIHINRHGQDNQIPPHKINNHANILALKEQGVSQIIGISSCGIINKNIQLGSLVLPHDFIDFSHPTFYDKERYHISLSDPFCPALRKEVIKTLESLEIPFSTNAVVICPRGPSLETRAEIYAFAKLGADLVTMTCSKEAILAKELGLCYASICTADNLAQAEDNLEISEIISSAKQSSKNITKLLEALYPTDKNCACIDAPEKGKFIS